MAARAGFIRCVRCAVVHSHVHERTQAHTQTQTQTQTQTHTHARMHARTHNCAQTHKRPQTSALVRRLKLSGMSLSKPVSGLLSLSRSRSVSVWSDSWLLATSPVSPVILSDVSPSSSPTSCSSSCACAARHRESQARAADSPLVTISGGGHQASSQGLLARQEDVTSSDAELSSPTAPAPAAVAASGTAVLPAPAAPCLTPMASKSRWNSPSEILACSSGPARSIARAKSCARGKRGVQAHQVRIGGDACSSAPEALREMPAHAAPMLAAWGS